MQKAFGVIAATLMLAPFAMGMLVAPPVPEIDAGSAVSALALLSGAAVVLRARRR